MFYTVYYKVKLNDKVMEYFVESIPNVDKWIEYHPQAIVIRIYDPQL